MNRYSIRKCTLNEIPQVLRLQKEWQGEEITYGFTAADHSYLQQKLGDYFYIAEQNGIIIAFAYANIEKARDMNIFEDGEHYLEIEDVYVAPTHRGTGAGSQLVKKLLQTAKDHGIERSLLFSSTKDIKKTMNFYEKLGFKTWNIQMYK
ncbi:MULTISPECIES: GNAT family N-acetyltransferase [unclassified Fusibacter]|uniref:GNAT family N-acetyltransferase n=1 Tax=unclassified Fusibacter TaxID=2624464 RepID=UPI0013E963B6|nr:MULTISPECIES: GNAT family N-acetyltransferase [unclassified Fusibacter]MCK8058351.1 GNAT family N-acetyltransferase [Fusibacter sp. A2]NPE20934.1 GNAT family N-acetyltransferase [Fusibacter sp. A1]